MINMIRFNTKNVLLCTIVITLGVGLLFVLQSSPSENSNMEIGDAEQYFDQSKHFSLYIKYFETVKRENGTTELIQLAKDIQRKHGVVMVSIINEAFLSFTFSWMCNTEGMNIHDHIIYITTDSQSKKMLDLHWKKTNSKSIYIPSLNLHGDQEYSKVGYVKMMNFRTQLILLMLINNVTVFLFETDCVWLSNPMPEIRSSLKSYDMLLVKPTRGKGVLGGFMVLKPTEATMSLWSNLSVQMWKLLMKIQSLPENKEISKIENDQVYFSKLIKMKYAHINVGFLSNKKFSDGKWYKFTEKERTQYTPLIINNNWIAGNKKKKERAEKWGHWFLRDNKTCDYSQIKKIVKSDVKM